MKLQRKKMVVLVGTLLCFALVIALGWAFGRNLMWAIANLGQARHSALPVRTPLVPTEGETYVRCRLLNLSVELPSSMIGSQKIEGRDRLRTLTFSDGDRKVVFTLIPYQEQRDFFGNLPKSLHSKTDARLMLEIYQTDTREYSFKMSPEQLAVYDWVVLYRNALAYDRIMDSLYFYQQNGVEVLCLSSDPEPGNKQVAIRREVIWSGTQSDVGGTIHILDARTAACEWGDVFSNSVRIATESATSVDWGNATDSQVLNSVRTEANRVER